MGIRSLSSIPRHHLLLFGLRQERQGSDVLIWISDHCFQQSPEVTHHSVNCTGLKQIGVVLQIAMERIGCLLQAQQHVKLGSSTLHIDRANCESRQFLPRQGHILHNK